MEYWNLVKKVTGNSDLGFISKCVLKVGDQFYGPEKSHISTCHEEKPNRIYQFGMPSLCIEYTIRCLHVSLNMNDKPVVTAIANDLKTILKVASKSTQMNLSIVDTNVSSNSG